MNEFEWLRQMRDLNTPEPPDHDLWPAIHARIRPPHRRRLRPWALAASVAAVMLLAGGIGWRLSLHGHPLASVARSPAAAQPWRPSDPRLSGAAVELYAARMELRQALAQSPHDASLKRLLQRTRMQERRLRQLPESAG